MSAVDVEERPAFVQGSPAPLFKGQGQENLLCSCGHTLVEGYLARQFIGIGFICYRCKALSISEQWPKGEPLPQQLVTLGRAGRFLVGSTVELKSKAGFTCDQEIERVQQETGARWPENNSLFLTDDGLNEFQEFLNAASEGEMDQCIQKDLRARARGNRRHLKSPPAWAINHLRNRLVEGSIDINDPEDCAAVAYICVLRQLIARWRHHPLFSLMSKGMVLEYPHTITQLIAASYLAEHANKIGFTDLADAEGRSPDLFLNVNSMDKISMEIKAPAELQWPNECPSANQIEKIVLNQIKTARGQLTGELGGVVILGASWLSREGERPFEEVVLDLIRRGKISSKVAGVVGVCLNIGEIELTPGVDKIKAEFSAGVFTCINSRFAGPDYLKT